LYALDIDASRFMVFDTQSIFAANRAIGRNLSGISCEALTVTSVCIGLIRLKKVINKLMVKNAVSSLNRKDGDFIVEANELPFLFCCVDLSSRDLILIAPSSPLYTENRAKKIIMSSIKKRNSMAR